MAQDSGYILTADDIDDVAVRISTMWQEYNNARLQALTMNQEARNYIFATDIDTTTASLLPHKNRTHQPKLTELSDRLQTHYWETALSSPDFFTFQAKSPLDRVKARDITALLRTKLEEQKFRETVGRELITDFVNYGNAVVGVNFETQKVNGTIVYRGPTAYRRAPNDLVINPSAKSFSKSPKIERELVHISEILDYSNQYPNMGFIKSALGKVLTARLTGVTDDWVDTIREQNITYDGFGGPNEYFKQDLVELFIYRGDIFNPEDGSFARNRVIYVVDRTFVIRNEPNKSPTGFDGLHAARWRVRNDNLWGMGPLDNLVGMQYRIDHLENLKADAFDLIVMPPLAIYGDDVSEPEEGYAPGAKYYIGDKSTSGVEVLAPNVQTLQANNEIQTYHNLMEQFSSAPAQKSGIRTPGEKTAFEVNTLEQNSSTMFVDKVRIFEQMLETMLQEMLELMLVNFDGTEYAVVTDDTTGAQELKELTLEDIKLVRGRFVAQGSRHWEQNNKKTLEMQQFQAGPMMDPKIRNHVSGIALANYWADRLSIQDEGIVEEYAGVKEDVTTQFVALAERQALSQQTGVQDPAAQGQPGTPGPVQSGQGITGSNPGTGPV